MSAEECERVTRMLRDLISRMESLEARLPALVSGHPDGPAAQPA
jgi:hypothetical protein